MNRLPVILLLCSVLTSQLASGQSWSRISVSSTGIEEDAPVLFEDKLVFITNRRKTSIKSETDDQGQSFVHRYYSKIGSDWSFGPVEEFAPELATEWNDGPATFSPDEQTICFTRMYAVETGGDRTSNPNSGLYFADYSADGWINIRPFEYNDPEVNFYSPCFSRDGKRLFFAATLPDSRGGFDLYVSDMVDGSWSSPVNLGDRINTPQHEFYPFAHSSGKLYFCSEGHDNTGGKDLFITVEENGEWMIPHKLEPPYNSTADDYSIYITDDYSTSFFVSKRRGGSRDIYMYRKVLPDFGEIKPQKINKFCYKLEENSVDTTDPAMFDYMWVINDTLTLYGRSIRYCFPGPGFYDVRFNVYNRELDTMMLNQGIHQLTLNNKVQTFISSPDTAKVGTEIIFNGLETYIPDLNIGKYYWDFGDGSPIEDGPEVRHTYIFPGTYKVILGVEERVRNRRDIPIRKANFKEIVIIPQN